MLLFAFFLERAQQRRLREAGDFDIIGIAAEVVEMKRDRVRAEGNLAGSRLFAGCRIGAERDAAAEGFIEAIFMNAIVDNIDQAAGGPAAVQQCCRAANDFNPLGEDAVYAHSVVLAQRGSVHRVERVRQHPDSLTVLAADDGP